MRETRRHPHFLNVIRDYRDLRVWTAAMDLAEAVYRTTAAFPRAERFALTSQIRRAAASVPANIAEGQVRDSSPDFLRFLAIAQGSLAELRTHLLLATRLNYITETHEPEIDELARQLAALRAAVKVESVSPEFESNLEFANLAPRARHRKKWKKLDCGRRS